MNKYYCFIISACFMQSLACSDEFTPRPKILLPESSLDKSKFKASIIAEETVLPPGDYFKNRVRVQGLYFKAGTFFQSSRGIVVEDVTRNYVPRTPVLRSVPFFTKKKQVKRLPDGQTILGTREEFLCAFHGSDGKTHHVAKSLLELFSGMRDNYYIVPPQFVDEALRPEPLKN